MVVSAQKNVSCPFNYGTNHKCDRLNPKVIAKSAFQNKINGHWFLQLRLSVNNTIMW